MAYSPDWVAKIITIPVSDLTFISGSNYSLDMADVHAEIRRLESAFDEGLWAAEVITFYPTVTLSGIAKPPTVEFINGYQVQFGGSNYNCSLLGYDSNMLDVLIPGNGISILANNSVGKITSGSGLLPAEQTQLDDIHKASYNRRKHDKTAKTVTVYQADKVTPHKVFDADDELTDITPQ